MYLHRSLYIAFFLKKSAIALWPGFIIRLIVFFLIDIGIQSTLCLCYKYHLLYVCFYFVTIKIQLKKYIKLIAQKYNVARSKEFQLLERSDKNTCSVLKA